MNLTILYGSQTGNAQDLAEQILRLSYLHVKPSVQCVLRDADSFTSAQNLQTLRCLIIVCSTTGQGDPPDNMRHYFWLQIMRRGLQPHHFAGLSFAVIGLGDSSYTRFNFVAKKIYRRLMQLGAKPLLPLGLLDDQHPRGWQAELEWWLPQLWTSLTPLLDMRDTPLLGEPLAHPKFHVEIVPLNSTRECGAAKSEKALDRNYPHRGRWITLQRHDRVTPEDHFQDTRFMTFSNEADLAYSPGDVLYIQPTNFPEEVYAFLKVLHSHDATVDADTQVQLSQCDDNFPIPEELDTAGAPLTVGWLVKHYFDLHCVPRLSFFEKLAIYSQHEDERERIHEWISSAEGLSELYSYCFIPKRTLSEVLQDLPHSARSVSLSQWFDLLTPIRPRPFSLASSPTFHPGELHLLVAVVTYGSVTLKALRQGLCSNYLAGLQPGDRTLAYTSKGSLHFPPPSVPLLLVGPGTGIAPLRSVLLDRLAHNHSSAAERSPKKPDLLFFGCRFSNKDNYFLDDRQLLQQSGTAMTLVAYSREQTVVVPGSRREKRCYVQDVIQQSAQLVWDTLFSSPASCFIVTGNSKSMPDEVKAAFQEVLTSHGKKTAEEAVQFVNKMESTGRYQTETWG